MIWNQLASAARSDDFLVLNTLEQPVKLVSCHLRPWFHKGRRVIALAEVVPSSLPTLWLLVEESTLPLLVVTKRGGGPWAEVSERLASAAFGSRVLQMVLDGNRLAADGSWVKEAEILDESGTTQLTISAANTRLLFAELPCDVPFRLANAQSSANLVRVGIEHPNPLCNSRLPGAIWLRIRGEGVHQGVLTVDLHPKADGDGWSFRTASPQLTVTQVPAPGSALAPMLRNVAWVVDRTCPDAKRWSDALALAMEIHPEPRTSGEFNAEIRRGICSALEAVDWPVDARMQMAWFGDGPGGELSPLKAVAPVMRCWGSAGESIALVDALQAVNTFTYMPGYDVWDPLGEALALCVPQFQRRGGGAVVIVGNSPPRYTANGPLREIGNALGFPTTYRESSEEFSRSLVALAALGVGVYYVFLTLGEHGAGEEVNFSAFDTLQQKVMSQLSLCLPGRLISAPATHEGVVRGIAEALTLAKNELGCSSVEVLYA